MRITHLNCMDMLQAGYNYHLDNMNWILNTPLLYRKFLKYNVLEFQCPGVNRGQLLQRSSISRVWYVFSH